MYMSVCLEMVPNLMPMKIYNSNKYKIPSE